MPNIDSRERLAILETELPHIGEDIAELKKKLSDVTTELDDLKAWKHRCTMAAGWWGTVLMGAMSAGAWVMSQWESIKHMITGSK